MREELKGPKVEEIGVSAVQEIGENGAKIYNVYVINFSDTEIEGVLVSSRGYGVNPTTQEQIKTSHLRHQLDNIPAQSYKKVEPIIEELFGLNNEYWVSFWKDGKLMDKKFIFLAETIIESNLVEVPVIEKRGVLIK